MFLRIILGRAPRARLTSYNDAECNRVSVLKFHPSAYSRISPFGEVRFTAGPGGCFFSPSHRLHPLRAAAAGTRGGQTGDSRRDARSDNHSRSAARVDRGGDRRGLGAGADRAGRIARAAGVSDQSSSLGAGRSRQGGWRERHDAWRPEEDRLAAAMRADPVRHRHLPTIYPGFDVNSDDWWHKPRERCPRGRGERGRRGQGLRPPGLPPRRAGILRRRPTPRARTPPR